MSCIKCCIPDCNNTARKTQFKFYRFPAILSKLELRKKWIAAVNSNISDGSFWLPKKNDRICSAHFVGQERSNSQLSPSYIPTIFPSKYNKKFLDEHYQKTILNRHKRFMKRRFVEKAYSEDMDKSALKNPVEIKLDHLANLESQEVIKNSKKLCVDQECQVDFFSDDYKSEKTLICNRYIYGSATCDAEIQTEIMLSKKIIIPNHKKYKDKECGTPIKIFSEQSTQCELQLDCSISSFQGFSSIKTKEQLLDLAGVSFNNFKFLLKRVEASDKSKVSIENRLLIFLTKMKTGLTFSALSVIFSVHRTTVSRIFIATLQQLVIATKNCVFWPDKYLVRATVPDCFKPQYSNTRVIIDCIEFRIEVPASVDNKVYCYSHYKKGFTAKVLVGITPGGFISFKSKVAGGRKSDSQLTIESDFIDLLEDGDIVLADKGFPDIGLKIDGKGKKVLIVMPPFLEKKNEFSKEETEETYSIARVRIHVERIMQRLRIFQILHKIPENLFYHVDEIFHICCVLVNLQPAIIADKKIDT